MKPLRCPICHSLLSLESLIQEDMGRALFTLVLKQKQTLQGALVSYLGLFRAGQRDLANDRALKLAHEVLELSPDADTLATALIQVVENMRQKQQAQGENWKPLKNHNYLKEVIKGVSSEYLVKVERQQPSEPAASATPRRLTSKTAQGLESLDALVNRYSE